MLVTVGQYSATTDKSANLDAATALIEQAAAQGSQLIVLPENAMYSNPDVTADIVRRTPSRSTAASRRDRHAGEEARHRRRRRHDRGASGRRPSAPGGDGKPRTPCSPWTPAAT